MHTWSSNLFPYVASQRCRVPFRTREPDSSCVSSAAEGSIAPAVSVSVQAAAHGQALELLLLFDMGDFLIRIDEGEGTMRDRPWLNKPWWYWATICLTYEVTRFSQTRYLCTRSERTSLLQCISLGVLSFPDRVPRLSSDAATYQLHVDRCRGAIPLATTIINIVA